MNEDQWLVKKRADTLRPGDRMIFSDDMGGEGETVTVEGVASYFGSTEIETLEYDFTIDTLSNYMVTIDTAEWGPAKEEA